MRGRVRVRVAFLVLVLACSDRKGIGEEAATSGVGDSTGISTGDTTETGEPSGCQPILQDDGALSGFEQCMSTAGIFRTSAETCTDPYPPSGGSCAYGTCFSDEDCDEAPYGACHIQTDVTAECNCVYGCTNDADCGPGSVCMCAPVDAGTICIDADCRSDADCLEGYRCELSPSGFYGLGASLHCHTPSDECQSDADCPEGWCRWAGLRWEC
jgi:hypothetical protein